MLVELFFDDLGFISGFRHSRSAKPTNKPIRENVFNIKREDLPELIRFVHGGTAYNVDSPPQVVVDSGEDKKHPSFTSNLLRLRNLDYTKKLDTKYLDHIIQNG